MYPWNDPLFPTWETLWEMEEVERGDNDCYYDLEDQNATVDGFGIPY